MEWSLPTNGSVKPTVAGSQTGGSSGQAEPLEEVDSPRGVEAPNSGTELKEVKSQRKLMVK